MRPAVRRFAVAAAFAAPLLARAQHSHGGGGGMDLSPRHEKHERPPAPAVPRGILPPGSARQIEVLVVSYGFSPTEIRADQGEEVVLTLRRSDDVHCGHGLAIPARQIFLELPVGETVPVTLRLDRAETIEVACVNEDVKASIVVAPR